MKRQHHENMNSFYSAPLRMATHSSGVLVMKQCSGKLKITVLLKNFRMENVNATGEAKL